MALGSAEFNTEILYFLNELEDCIIRISVEADIDLVHGDDLLLEAETLLHDVSDLMKVML